MPQSYTPEFKKKIVRLHEEEGRTYKSITAEYGVDKSSISKWCTELRRECLISPEAKEEYDSMKELLKLKRENEELRKENLFLKKAAAFFAKEIDQRLIDLLNNITQSLESDGCLCGSVFAQMLITTIGNTGRRITIPNPIKYYDPSGYAKKKDVKKTNPLEQFIRFMSREEANDTLKEVGLVPKVDKFGREHNGAKWISDTNSERN